MFTTLAKWGNLNWRVFIDANSGAVPTWGLGGVRGYLVFIRDPASRSNDATVEARRKTLFCMSA
jgi:hypothetical protein